MKIKTLLAAFIAVLAAGILAVSCNKDESLVGTTWKYEQSNMRKTVKLDSKDGCTYIMEQYDGGSDSWSTIESKGTYILNGEDITFLWITSLDYIGEWKDCKVKGNVMTVVIDDEEWKLIKQ